MAKTSESRTGSGKSAGAKTKARSGRPSSGAVQAKAKPAGPPRQPGVERRHNHPSRAKHGAIQLILTQNVRDLGQAGDAVKVRPGYARNYLVPQGLATFATPANLRLVEKHRQRQRELEEARRADLMSMAAQISQRAITIEANANAEGHLYGSVNADQIAQALSDLGFSIEGEHVRIDGPLKELGLYSIRIVLAPEIEGEVKLWVVPTHTEEAAS